MSLPSTLRVLIGLLAVLASTPAEAKTTKYAFDPLHSAVTIKVNHLGFSSYYLRAGNVIGDIAFNQKKPEKSSVSATVQANAVDGGNQKLNQHLRSADFFDTKAFPALTFTSTGIQVTGEKTALISGILTIRGISQPVVLNTTFNKEGENLIAQDYRAGFSANAKVKRSDYGMTYGLPALGDEIELFIEVEAIRQ